MSTEKPQLSNPGAPPRTEVVSLDRFFIDDAYQRSVGSLASRKLIQHILENFDWKKFAPVVGVERSDGRIAIVDGQHRVEAAWRHPHISAVPVYLIEAENVASEARVFVGVNTDRIKVQVLQLFHAQVTAKDPDALHVKYICDQAGISIPRSATNAADLKPKQTIAIATIRKLLKSNGDAIVLKALNAIVAAYPDEAGQLRSQLISAVTTFLVRFKDCDYDRLVNVLAEDDADTMIESARAYRKNFKSSTVDAIVAALVRLYNKGLKANRLPEAA